MKEQPRTPTLGDVIRHAISSQQAELHVSLPGAIEKYDREAQRADIQPLLRRPLVAADGTELAAETLPILHDVPIVFPRGGQGSGAFFISWPLEPGDLVHLVFVERSMDVWLGSEGAITTPLDYRMHSLSDAVAYPGLYPAKRPLADAHAENLVVGLDGSIGVHVRPDGEIHLGSDGASDYVALAASVKDEISVLRDAVNSLVLLYNAHVHPGVTSGPSATSATALQAAQPSIVGDVGAEKVKAD